MNALSQSCDNSLRINVKLCTLITFCVQMYISILPNYPSCRLGSVELSFGQVKIRTIILELLLVRIFWKWVFGGVPWKVWVKHCTCMWSSLWKAQLYSMDNKSSHIILGNVITYPYPQCMFLANKSSYSWVLFWLCNCLLIISVLLFGLTPSSGTWLSQCCRDHYLSLLHIQEFIISILIVLRFTEY